ncbi:MAG: sensor histidine kinase [Oscillospiraceae bacterium]|nr:sensor histidine kinase [Oscillospiraceae bacterium]
MKFKIPQIKTKMIATFSLIIIVCLLISFFCAFYITANVVKESNSRYTTQIISQINTNLDYYFEYMENVADLATINPDVRSFMQDDLSQNELDDAKKNVFDYFNVILKSRKDIRNIVLINANGDVLLNQEGKTINPHSNYQNSDWYKNAVSAKGGTVFTTSHVQNIIYDQYPWVVSLSRAIYDYKQSKLLGVVLIDLNYDVITDLCKSVDMGRRGYLYILDREGDMVYHPAISLIYSGLSTELKDEILQTEQNTIVSGKGNSKKLYTIFDMPTTQWKIVAVSYENEILQDKEIIEAMFIVMGILFSLIATALSIFFSLKLTRPLQRLEKNMKKVKEGNFDIHIPIESTDETGRLSETFNNMVDKIKQLMQESIADQKQKRLLELKALQSQINPHFLYNTLDSIIWMAESGEVDDVVEMTSALSKLFRTSISKGSEIISFCEELENISSYLTIQQIRYKDKLRYHIDVQDKIKQCKVLKLILQPLVENAIYHGIKQAQEPGQITIKAFEQNNNLVVEISDNGAGMQPEVLERILTDNPIKVESSRKSSGIGTTNVNQRIKLAFGEQYGLSYQSTLGQGTTVVVTLPIIK